MFVIHKGVEVAGEYLTPGMLTDKIPAEAVAWLTECGAIEAVDAPGPAPKKKGGR
jgi:hypothetical protein